MLPRNYQAILEAAAKAHSAMLSKYDAQNPKALRELVASGTKLMPSGAPVMEASYNAANQVYEAVPGRGGSMVPRCRQLHGTQSAANKL